MKTFEQWLNIFNSQNFYEFNTDSTGIIWLKIKSLIRKEILEYLVSKYVLYSKKQNDKFKEIYELTINNKITISQIDSILTNFNKKEIAEIENKFNVIESELYKMTYFAWGGDATNSLDKQIISYVKNIYKYDEILYKIDNEITENTKNYTLSSWYNNWTTILTEHIFKSHSKVVSAVGKIKSVDFFINDIPIDLKITYLPREFLKLQRKKYGFGSEITILKQIAKENSIVFDKNANEEVIKYQIIQQIKDSSNTNNLFKLCNIERQNKQIITDVLNNKNILIQWLYENQGELRFGAENRLFIVLIDNEDFSQSWKLKRNFKLLSPIITNYLNNFNALEFKKNIISFTFKQKTYKTLADIIFINKQ